jgi:outer membrane protein
VAFGAANLFFDILIAQLNEAAALKDKANADTLLTISRGRFEVGRIAETELLQIELSAMNADAALAQARLDLQSNTERLRNFLGLTTPVFFSCVPPYDIPVFPVDAERALELARQNRAEIVDFDLRVAQARRELAVAKGNRGLNATLSGSFGLSQTAPNLEGAYMDPLDQERIRLGLNIPIADWGKARARVEQALTNQALTEMTVAQEKINFEQEVLLQVQQFDLVRQQVFLAQRAYEVAQKRQEMTRNRYYIGKIGITELNIAISEQDSARRAYIFALRAFWVAYYDLRRTTLFDFETGESLFRELDGLE